MMHTFTGLDETTAQITIDERSVDVTVSEPMAIERHALVSGLPDAVATGEPLTLEESDAIVTEIVKATTRLPRELIEQLPGGTMMTLYEAALDVLLDEPSMAEIREQAIADARPPEEVDPEEEIQRMIEFITGP